MATTKRLVKGSPLNVNEFDANIDAIDSNASNISTLQSEQTTQNAAIALNTAKVSFDSTSSSRLANTSGTNTGDQDLSGKQDTLVSGTNIKTINGESLLGSTDIVISAGGGDLSTTDIDTLSKLNTIVTDATLIDTADARLSDSRTPTAHNHTASEITDFDTEVSNNTDVAANTAKTGITAQQAADILTNNAKVGVTTEEANTINSITAGEPTGSDQVLNVVSLTQAEYDAGTPVSTTHYIITDAPAPLSNVVEDTTPQLGGELDCGANSIGGTVQTATGDGATTIDWKLGNMFSFQFGAFNETFTFTAPTKPGTFILKLVQDSVGSRTATWPASVKWAGGTAPTLTTTATTGTDIITLFYDGTDYFCVDALNFS